MGTLAAVAATSPAVEMNGSQKPPKSKMGSFALRKLSRKQSKPATLPESPTLLSAAVIRCASSPSMVKVPALAVPQVGSCASSGHFWRPWAAPHSQELANPLGAQPLLSAAVIRCASSPPVLTRTTRGLRTARVLVSCVLHVPEAQGRLPRAGCYCAYEPRPCVRTAYHVVHHRSPPPPPPQHADPSSGSSGSSAGGAPSTSTPPAKNTRFRLGKNTPSPLGWTPDGARARPASAGNSLEKELPNGLQPTGPLDPGWTTLTAQDGRSYFWNEATGATTWARPSTGGDGGGLRPRL